VVRPGLLGGAARERVLHDLEARAVREQLGAKCIDLRHRQAAVVRDDQRVGRAQALGQIGDDAFLLFLVHVISSRK
jgi:hypothetical protein